MARNPTGNVVRELFAQGMPVEEIMRQTGLSRARVGQYLSQRNRANQDRPQQGRPQDDVREIFKERRKKAKDMMRQGMMAKDVKHEMGMSSATISACRKELKKEEGIEVQTGWQGQAAWPQDLQERWVEAVNPIRKYYGKDPFPMPHK